ncbi:MAG TPA: serine hydrolase domain-containing protein [Acidobacteriaceae bacterium]|nr:serine hydrolase domain-containing protein [Acidobacteriaceae bacterium]
MTEQSTSRRRLLRHLIGATAAGMVSVRMHAFGFLEGQAPVGMERAQIGRLAAGFKRRFSVPALSIAISRNGQFVFDQGFGFNQGFRMGNVKDMGPTDISSLFRIADVTMPITAVAIFTLIEQGKLHLTDKVFGASGLLGTKYGKSPYQQYVTEITVDNLLTHTSGGWPADSTDPMFNHNSWDQTRLIDWTLENVALTNPPGTHWAFSNFGYCLLGRVIEQVAGQAYADYVQNAVLAPCGIVGMRIGGNSLKQRAPNEVVYFGQYNEDPYKINVTRMDANGGWIATPSALVQFLNHIGGSGTIPSILKAETIRAMSTPSPVFPNTSAAKYARGWMVNSGNLWHNGSFPGSTTIMVRTATGMCWAALTNTRTEPHDEIDSALDELMWSIAHSVPAWNA